MRIGPYQLENNLENLGVEATILDLRDLPEDFLVSSLYENAGKNESFNPLRTSMKDSEKFVFIVPEYNGSFPGVLKAFIDGLKFPDECGSIKFTIQCKFGESFIIGQVLITFKAVFEAQKRKARPSCGPLIDMSYLNRSRPAPSS